MPHSLSLSNNQESATIINLSSLYLALKASITRRIVSIQTYTLKILICQGVTICTYHTLVLKQFMDFDNRVFPVEK